MILTPDQLGKLREEMRSQVRPRSMQYLTDERLQRCWDQAEAHRPPPGVYRPSGNDEWIRSASKAVQAFEPPQGLIASIIISIIFAVVKYIIEKKLAAG